MRFGYGRKLSVAAIILAAGGSTRLGEAKQLVMLNGEMLLERALRIAREAGCAPVVIVLGAEAERIRAACALDEAAITINARWREGMASSIRAGVVFLSTSDEDGKIAGTIVMTCDQPAVTAGHLRALAASGQVAASEYAGRRGVPAYFPRGSFAALSELNGEAGARDLLCDAQTIPLDGGELDIDTGAELNEARRRFRS